MTYIMCISVLVISWREARSSICRLVTGMVVVAQAQVQAPNTKLSITRSFLELQSPHFVWKFVWTVRTKYKSTKVQKVQKSKKVLITQPFLELQTPDFA